MLYRAIRSRGVRGGGAGEYQGDNRDYGALITFSLNAPGLPLPDAEQERARKEAERAAERQSAVTQPSGVIKEDAPPSETSPAEEPEGEGRRGGRSPQAEIRISDASGKVIRTMKTDVKRGLNRVVWDLGRDEFRTPPRGDRGFPRDGSGPSVAPGTYNVAVKYGKEEARGTLKVEADPQLGVAANDWQAWDAAVNRVGQLQDAVTEAVERVAATRADVGVVLSKLDARSKARERSGETGNDPDRDLRRAARDLQKRLDEVERKLYVPPGTKGIVEDRTAQNRMEYMRRYLGSSFTTPTGTVKGHMETAETTVREVLAEVNKLYTEEVPAFRQKVTAAQIDLLGAQGPIEVK
jgi:hypothetical protein